MELNMMELSFIIFAIIAFTTVSEYDVVLDAAARRVEVIVLSVKSPYRPAAGPAPAQDPRAPADNNGDHTSERRRRCSHPLCWTGHLLSVSAAHATRHTFTLRVFDVAVRAFNNRGTQMK